MSIKYRMSWIAARKGWMKNHQGKRYAVSCKQLDVPETKEASWRAANAWWEAKEAELEKAKEANIDPTARRVAKLNPAQLVEEAEAGLTVQLVKTLLERLRGREKAVNVLDAFSIAEAIDNVSNASVPPGSVATALGIDGEADLNERLDKLTAAKQRQASSPRSVAVKVGEWIALQRSRTTLPKADGGLNLQRYDSYQREINRFLAWLPAGATIAELTGNCWERWYTHVAEKLGNGEWSARYCHAHMSTARMFLSWLSEDEELDYVLPKKVTSRRYRFKIPKAEPQPLPVETVQMLLSACTELAQRTGLFILLGVQCGMYQSDISDLAQDEVNLEAGTIRRSRSKTPDGPKVTYKLWPETLALMKRFQATAKVEIRDGSGKPVKDREGNLRYHFFLTDEGKPLVQSKIGAKGRVDQTDNVGSAYDRLRLRLKLEKPVQFKRLRKTGACKLQDHPSYKFFSQYFLAQAPRTVAEQHYVVPSDREFFEACDWLRTQIIPAGWQPKFADEAA
jgi:integrase